MKCFLRHLVNAHSKQHMKDASRHPQTIFTILTEDFFFFFTLHFKSLRTGINKKIKKKVKYGTFSNLTKSNTTYGEEGLK